MLREQITSPNFKEAAKRYDFDSFLKLNTFDSQLQVPDSFWDSPTFFNYLNEAFLFLAQSKHFAKYQDFVDLFLKKFSKVQIFLKNIQLFNSESNNCLSIIKSLLE